MAYCKFQTPCGFCSLRSIEGLAAIKCNKCTEEPPTCYEEKQEQTNEDETS